MSKTIQHTPMTWCTYLQSFEKIHHAFSSSSAKTKRDRRTGALQYLPSRAFGAVGDNAPNLTFLTLAMTFRVMQSNSSQFIVTNEEASGQNREKVTKQVLNKLDLSDLEK